MQERILWSTTFFKLWSGNSNKRATENIIDSLVSDGKNSNEREHQEFDEWLSERIVNYGWIDVEKRATLSTLTIARQIANMRGWNWTQLQSVFLRKRKIREQCLLTTVLLSHWHSLKLTRWSKSIKSGFCTTMRTQKLKNCWSEDWKDIDNGWSKVDPIGMFFQNN